MNKKIHVSIGPCAKVTTLSGGPKVEKRFQIMSICLKHADSTKKEKKTCACIHYACVAPPPTSCWTAKLELIPVSFTSCLKTQSLPIDGFWAVKTMAPTQIIGAQQQVITARCRLAPTPFIKCFFLAYLELLVH